MSVKTSNLKYSKPTTSSRRGLVLVNKSNLWKGKPYKSLTVGKHSTGGRNMHGRRTANHRGGGHKRSYRIIALRNIEGKFEVIRIEYDPNRTANIALIKSIGSEVTKHHYIIASKNMKSGDIVECSNSACEIAEGNTMPLKLIPVGSYIYNIAICPGGKAKLVRAAGTCAQLKSKMGGKVLITLPSGESRYILSECKATLGTVSNIDHKNQNLGKAGRSRWLGRRPNVRGVAKNPHDHPLGGGEGKTSGGRHPVSATGVLAKGKKTRNPRKLSSRLIVSQRRKKR